ncbi:3-hydroxyisobutyrate dehydrogenase [Reticulomyxa filosa]|uniref:3-hydroxyisobutyrate dehydrogenase n=1 Tax=Reticulomyxa filosa TaxID=46433 RepID=X6P120_RETFI|nr:3-hydroxyisobutyrate dehydrogenase [Reticulomyxa filosa]|eukprot:ETO32265.1 3-hydroxyisobutyrate dehydrogenase [Reticulomyxa filosa]
MTIFNRTRSKCEPLEKLGAKFVESPMHVAQLFRYFFFVSFLLKVHYCYKKKKKIDVIFSIVGYPKDVRETFLGKKGILAGAKPGSIVVDMTTSEPSLAEEIAAEAAKKKIKAFDAPVSGGDVGAKNATLSIMVGGDKSALDKVHGLFQLMGKTIQYMGPAGRGQHTKMVNQILIASNMVNIMRLYIAFTFVRRNVTYANTIKDKQIHLLHTLSFVLLLFLSLSFEWTLAQIGVCEGLLYAHKVGLNLEEVIKAVGGGGAASFSINVLGPRIVKGDFNPGFFVEHFIKDMGIALEESKRMNLSLPGLALAQQLYIALQAQGHGRKGTQALVLALESLSGGKKFATLGSQFSKL